jgi:hypothetical protein
MVDVITQIRVARPLSEVSGFAADPSNAPRWHVNIKRAEWKTPHPLRPGSRIAFTAHFLGRKPSYTYEVTEFSATKL